jgi:magnesium transporter
VLTAHRYRAGSDDAIEPDTISDCVAEPGAIVWVDGADATDADLDKLAEEFSLHPLAVEDAKHHHQRPKIERYPTHAFVVAYSAQLSEVDIFVGPTWVVTVRAHNESGEEWDPSSARGRFQRTNRDPPIVGLLLHTIVDELVETYFDRLDEIETAVEELEERIFGEELRDERAIQQALFDQRRTLIEFRRVVAPLRDVLSEVLRGEVSWIKDEVLFQFQDLFDHLLRAVDLIDSQRELMGNAVDAHLAIISNRMNQVMKQLTAWGAIVFGATLIAGIYGMNFDHMPELHWYLGYPMALDDALLRALLVVQAARLAVSTAPGWRCSATGRYRQVRRFDTGVRTTWPTSHWSSSRRKPRVSSTPTPPASRRRRSSCGAAAATRWPCSTRRRASAS